MQPSPMAPRGGILGYHGVCSLSQHAERCIGPTVDVRNHKGVQMDTGLAGKVVLAQVLHSVNDFTEFRKAPAPVGPRDQLVHVELMR